MKFAYAALTSLGLLSFTAPAMAEGWVVANLGETANLELCMSRAEYILNSAMVTHGGHSVERGAWAVYAYDLEPGDNDVVIMCAAARGGHNALLAVYGAFVDAADDQSDLVAKRLESLWKGGK